jgi:hypothetical protein
MRKKSQVANRCETYQLLTVGLIPINHGGGLLVMGDPSYSNTKEINLKILDDQITCQEISTIKISGRKKDWFSEKTKFWSQVANEVNSFFESEIKIEPRVLSNVWSLVMDEPISRVDIAVNVNAQFGELKNDSRRYNGSFYFRYQVFENDDVQDEIVITANLC